jgi:cell division protein FtsW (lipid II flippase)
MLMCFLAGRGGGESRRFILMLILCIVWIVPILLQPDMGTALIYMVAFGIVYWCSGGKIRYLFYSLPVACPFLFFFIYRHPYILSRFYGFWDPEGDFSGKGWHIMQFRYTLSRGGLAGAESGRALWANSYLPLAHSDSAFASLVESVGLIGSLPVVAGIMVLCYIAFRAACLGGDAMRGNLIFSIAAVFAFQSLVHIGVNVTLLPPTGITLPILSYGGSSLVSTMVAFGIMLSAARGNNYSALRLRNG